MAEKRETTFDRRGFLKGTAAASLGTAAAAAGVTGGVTPAAADPPAPIPPHGAELRGMNLVTKSPTTEGRFGFMFKNQPPHRALGACCSPPGSDHGGTARHRHPHRPEDRCRTVSRQQDHNDAFNENPNPLLTSGFTFVGQFVDHDITFDTTTSSTSSSPTPTPPPTSAPPATTSTPSTGGAPARTRSSTTPTTGTSS